MKLTIIGYIFLTLTLNAMAIDVILNPFENLDYDKINTYTFEECNCDCYE